MSLPHISPLLLAGTLLLPGVAPADERWSGNVNGFIGGKHITGEDFEADRHGEIGIMFDLTPPGMPVSLAIDHLGSYGEDSNSYYDPIYGWSDAVEEVSTSELDFGVRKSWALGGRGHPYIGGGISLFALSKKQYIEPNAYNLTITTYDESGSGAGLWVDGGIYWTFNHFNLGFDMRASRGEVDLNDAKYQAGGNHMGLMLGYHW